MGRNARRRRRRDLSPEDAALWRREADALTWRERDDQLVAHRDGLQLLVEHAARCGHWHVEVFEHGPQRAWRGAADTETEAKMAAVAVSERWPEVPGGTLLH